MAKEPKATENRENARLVKGGNDDTSWVGSKLLLARRKGKRGEVEVGLPSLGKLIKY